MVLFKTLFFFILSILTCGNSLVVQKGASNKKNDSDGRLTKAKNAKEDLTPKAKSFAPTTNLAHKNPPTLRQKFNASKADQAKESKTSTTSNEIDSFDRSWIVLDSQVQDFSSDTGKEFSEISALSFGTVLAIGEDGRVNAFASSDASVSTKPAPPAPAPVIIPVMKPVPIPTPFPVLVPAPTLTIGGSFCWKDSYGRGAGSIPETCPSDRDRIDLLCYSRCPEGFYRAGYDCWQRCPESFRDDGAFCRLAEYGRGVGYVQYSQCESDHGKGNCEGWGLFIYPKCAAGFSNALCCICRPSQPDCSALGFAGQLDLSCTKRTITGDPIPLKCADDLQYDTGLCYPRCDNGYDGVGPVCWSGNPPGWVNCGFGSAKDKSTCDMAMANQVISVGAALLNIATLGAGSSVTNPIVKGSSQYNEVQLLFKDAFPKITKMVQENPNNVLWAKTFFKGWTIKNLATLNLEEHSIEDQIRIAAGLLALLDPTGVSGLMAAYTYPKCSKLMN